MSLSLVLYVSIDMYKVVVLNALGNNKGVCMLGTLGATQWSHTLYSVYLEYCDVEICDV